MRNVVRHVVKFGQMQAFIAAHRAFNERCVANGLPPYRVYEASWSAVFNEVFAEVEFDSVAAAEAGYARAFQDPTFGAAMEDVFAHCVDGQSHDYMLREIDLAE